SIRVEPRELLLHARVLRLEVPGPQVDLLANAQKAPGVRLQPLAFGQDLLLFALQPPGLLLQVLALSFELLRGVADRAAFGRGLALGLVAGLTKLSVRLGVGLTQAGLELCARLLGGANALHQSLVLGRQRRSLGRQLRAVGLDLLLPFQQLRGLGTEPPFGVVQSRLELGQPLLVLPHTLPVVRQAPALVLEPPLVGVEPLALVL